MALAYLLTFIMFVQTFSRELHSQNLTAQLYSQLDSAITKSISLQKPTKPAVKGSPANQKANKRFKHALGAYNYYFAPLQRKLWRILPLTGTSYENFSCVLCEFQEHFNRNGPKHSPLYFKPALKHKTLQQIRRFRIRSKL